MDSPNTWGSPHEIVRELAAYDQFTDPGPCLYRGYRITVSQRITVATYDPDCALDIPPARISRVLNSYRGRNDCPKPKLDALLEWAGDPIHPVCTCRNCGRRLPNIGLDNYRPGWLGEYLVDRRLIALALLLATPKQRRCDVDLYPPRTGFGGPIRLSGKLWWSVVMGLETCHGHAVAPRFEL